MTPSRALVPSPRRAAAGLLCLLASSLLSSPGAGVDAFAPAPSSSSSARGVQRRATTTALPMAGFGGASTKKGGKKKNKGGPKLKKLKAKTQWDRYQKDLKSSPPTTVGVRPSGEDEWLEVGRVKSADDGMLEAAVARQRALIAEHAKRLYPVRVLPDAAVEWGYDAADGDGDAEWIAVDKSKGEDAPDGIEKRIGFEGISDKASGFYCYYHEGRIVEREEEGMGNRGSGFKAIKGK